MNDVERLWVAARNRNGEHNDRRRPSAGIAALLLELHRRGPQHGRALARATEQSQPNVTAHWLPKLARFGFVDHEVVPGLGNQGGGRPARVWRLTRAGRELAGALAAAHGAEVA